MDFFKLKDNEVPNRNIPTYYIEDASKLASLPADAPVGTIVIMNGPAPSGFKVFMKDSKGAYNEL